MLVISVITPARGTFKKSSFSYSSLQNLQGLTNLDREYEDFPTSNRDNIITLIMACLDE